ncbi:formate dehydrogenase accessory sulfurtransferase FdhD [Sandaracinobacter neustonicus]|uniref:Sulfur carrier protein FdhD n=1 Tax=Sandaracinobacter neustonicus TaxID=1715348 RepID=A0A501XHU3_9SPHN|nr:formate dehydrogenase accessory sulfurtransferase FdhD [Sandaracinobacter neustonicus]TPE60201.1 formate dehydrogenase accessory sulfurtransferase FdhD [Sandaracinobacter neustonicus]
MTGYAPIPALLSPYAAGGEPVTRDIPLETPIAIEISGISYAVMMATPADIADFVTGFLLSEGLASVAEIGEIAIHPVRGGEGMVARTSLPAERMEPILARARRRLGDSSCGLCGLDSVEEALRPLPRLAIRSSVRPEAIRLGLAAMRDAQALGARTRATHAAAFLSETGALVALREDVGRHNALDKLIGALARQGISPAQGFIAVTSRCSYELVEKTVRAGCPLLVAVSAPTQLAVSRAQAAGLAMAAIARDDSLLWVSGPALDGE